jgi:malate dehydrogenase
MSAANAALDHVRSLITPTPAGDWISAGIVSNGEYAVTHGLVFGYPCRNEQGQYRPVNGLQLDAFGKGKFDVTHKELKEELEAVKDLLPS